MVVKSLRETAFEMGEYPLPADYQKRLRTQKKG